jgi:hypothetical protein
VARATLVPRASDPAASPARRSPPRRAGSRATALARETLSGDVLPATMPEPGPPFSTGEPVLGAVPIPPAEPSGGQDGNEPDVGGLAERVYEMLVRRLAIERERRGLS